MLRSVVFSAAVAFEKHASGDVNRKLDQLLQLQGVLKQAQTSASKGTRSGVDVVQDRLACGCLRSISNSF
jgi:hypothetical protein